MVKITEYSLLYLRAIYVWNSNSGKLIHMMSGHLDEIQVTQISY